MSRPERATPARLARSAGVSCPSSSGGLWPTLASRTGPPGRSRTSERSRRGSPPRAPDRAPERARVAVRVLGPRRRRPRSRSPRSAGRPSGSRRTSGPLCSRTSERSESWTLASASRRGAASSPRRGGGTSTDGTPDPPARRGSACDLSFACMSSAAVAPRRGGRERSRSSPPWHRAPACDTPASRRVATRRETRSRKEARRWPKQEISEPSRRATPRCWRRSRR